MAAGTLYNSSPVLLRRSEGGFKKFSLDVLLFAYEALERGRQRRALAKLDDRMLSDIGISRCDVERELEKAPWEV